MAGWFARARQRRRDRRALLVLWTCAALERAWGVELRRVTGLRYVSIYRTLDRLEDDGLVSAEWEQPEPRPDGRPRRRYYAATETGRRHARYLAVRLARPGV